MVVLVICEWNNFVTKIQLFKSLFVTSISFTFHVIAKW